MQKMRADREMLIAELQQIVSTTTERKASLHRIADLLKIAGSYRWVGLYDVDRTAGIVRNIVWSGPAAPEYSTFAITRGLTGVSIAARKTINVGDVATDARYLTAFDSTRSEMIVPVFDEAGENVIGTIDIESEKLNAFSDEVQAVLEGCSAVIRPLWASGWC